MRNAKTVQLASALDMTTNYQTIDFPSDLGAVVAQGGQCVLTFKRTGGTSITFKIDEYFSELTGWIPKGEDDGSAINTIERTVTDANFSFAFSTLAEKIRVQAKASSTTEDLDVFLTVGEIS